MLNKRNSRCTRKSKEHVQESNQCSQFPILNEISTMYAVPMTIREFSLSGEVTVLPLVLQ